MAIRLITEAYKRDVKGTDQRVLILLCDHANGDGVCWPSIDRMAWELGLHRTAVMRSVGNLEGMGVLSIKRRHRKNNIYRIDLDAVPHKPPFRSDDNWDLEGDDWVAESDPKPTGEITQSDPRNNTERPKTKHSATPTVIQPPNESSVGASAPKERHTKKDDPWAIVEAYMNATGTERPARKGFQAAKNMIGRGMTAGDVEPFVRWIESQDWAAQKGFDLNTLDNQWDRYRNATRASAERVEADLSMERIEPLCWAFVDEVEMHGPLKYEARERPDVESAIRDIAEKDPKLQPEDVTQLARWIIDREGQRSKPDMGKLTMYYYMWHKDGRPTLKPRPRLI